MKNKVMGMVIGGVLVAGVVGSVSAYSTQIWSPIQFVKQLFVSPTGQVGDVQGATIKIDGTNGRIDAKSVYVNGKELATEEYVDNKTSNTLTEAKNYTNTKSNQVLNSAKSYADQKKVEAINAAKAYTNNHVVDGAHIANGVVTEDKLNSNLRSKINNTLSEEDMENMGFKKFVNSCNVNNIGKRRRSDLKMCDYYEKSRNKIINTKRMTFKEYCKNGMPDGADLSTLKCYTFSLSRGVKEYDCNSIHTFIKRGDPVGIWVDDVNNGEIPSCVAKGYFRR